MDIDTKRVKRNNGKTRERSRTPPPNLSELRIVLVGKTGSGKSSSANTILGKEAFKVDFSPESVTTKCEQVIKEVDGRLIKVVDTPGLFDTKGKSKEELKSEVERCLDMSDPGPHAFLLVIRLGHFTEEEKNTVMWIQENFGERALNYTIILFTFGDQLKGGQLDTYLCKSPYLVSLTNSSGGYHVFNNDEKTDRTQVRELFTKIETMVGKNGGECYTNKVYLDAQEKIHEKEKRERQEEERKQRIGRQREKRKRMEYEAKVQEERKIAEEERKRRDTAEMESKKQQKKAKDERDKRIESDRKRKYIEIALAEEKKHANLQTKVALAGGIAGAFLATGGLAVAGAGAAVAAVGGAAVGSTAAALTYKFTERLDPSELLMQLEGKEQQDSDDSG